MNTCGINIGPDCEALILDYLSQLVHTEKFSKCLTEITNIIHYEYYCPFITDSKITRIIMDKKVVEYRIVEFINYGLHQYPHKYSELMIHNHTNGLYNFIK